MAPEYAAASHTWIYVKSLQESEDQLAQHLAVQFIWLVPGQTLILSVSKQTNKFRTCGIAYGFANSRYLAVEVPGFGRCWQEQTPTFPEL